MATKKILIAEDDKPIGNAISIKLQKEGFEIKLVSDGQQAVDEAKKGGFDLLLLDLIMPVMNGFEVLEYLQKNKISIPTIVLSNLGQEEDIQKAKGFGAIDYFIKSDIDLAQIVENINKFFKK